MEFVPAFLVNFCFILLQLFQVLDAFDLCATHSICQNGAACKNVDNWVECSCAPGFRGEHCQIDVRLNTSAIACTACTRTCSGGSQYCAQLYTYEAGSCTTDTDCTKVSYARVATSQDIRIYQQPCNSDPCPQHGIYEEWGHWSACSSTCGEGIKQRTRKCIAPLYGGDDCAGDSTNRTFCNIAECPAVRRIPRQFIPTPAFKLSDRRTTAVGIGVVGIVSIVVVGALIVYLDVMSFCLARQMKKARMRRKTHEK